MGLIKNDIVQVLLAGGWGFSVWMTNFELALKVLTALAALGFILWKWRCAYVDRKQKKKDEKI